MNNTSTDFMSQLVLFWITTNWLGKMFVVLSMPVLLAKIFAWSITWGLLHHYTKISTANKHSLKLTEIKK